jgi:hypothetical protein
MSDEHFRQLTHDDMRQISKRKNYDAVRKFFVSASADVLKRVYNCYIKAPDCVDEKGFPFVFFFEEGRKEGRRRK